MAPHSSALAWKIPWTEEPGGLQFMKILQTKKRYIFQGTKESRIIFNSFCLILFHVLEDLLLLFFW